MINNEIAETAENHTPSLALVGLEELRAKVAENRRKVGERKKSTPYWQSVKGIIRWELRQHYYDEDGRRRTRVLETRKNKPRRFR